MRSRYRLALAIIVLGLVGATIFLVRPAQPVGLSWQALRNATYPTSLPARTVALHDGLYEAEAAPGSAAKVFVRLADLAAFGDLDEDNMPDAAVILITSGGGSGVFIDLVAVRNENGAARPLARTQLGDRVLVREARIEGRVIVVRIRARGAADPLTLLTHEVTRRYALENGQLVLRDETTADVALTSPDRFTYTPERVDLAPGASRSLQGTLLQGQIASYVIRGEPGQTLDIHARSLFNNAVLSISGLTDGLTLVSRQEYAVDRTLLLPLAQDYAVRLVTLGGSPLPFTLDVSLAAAQKTPEPTRPSAAPLPSATPRPASSPPRAALADRALGQLSDQALTFTRSRSPIVGVAVAVPGSGAIYTENADEQVPTASVVKVLVMLVVLERARQERRPVTESELALLWPMITASDNDSTSALWEDIGRGQAIAGFMAAAGVTGFTPDPGTQWGVSFASARAMAAILGKLVSGEILDEPSRALALRLMDSVIPQQRWGVAAGASEGDLVAIKDGWYPGDEGWRVNSVGIVRPKTGSPYAIAVMTGGRASWDEGIETIEGVAQRVRAARRASSFLFEEWTAARSVKPSSPSSRRGTMSCCPARPLS